MRGTAEGRGNPELCSPPWQLVSSEKDGHDQGGDAAGPEGEGGCRLVPKWFRVTGERGAGSPQAGERSDQVNDGGEE
jgi:hypothetical protein